MTEEKNNAQEANAAQPAPAPATQAAVAKPAAAVAAKKVAAKPAAKPVAKGSAKPAAKPAAAKAVTKPAAKQAASPAATKPPVARKRSAVDETVDKHQKELADALEQAQAIKYDKSKHIKPATKAAKPAKAEKPVKAKKQKLVRDSFAMPEGEYALIGEIKKRLAGEYKKSELLRAGVIVLAALNDTELKAVMGHIERIKTGRPSKK
jgi:hypothetical protein